MNILNAYPYPTQILVHLKLCGYDYFDKKIRLKVPVRFEYYEPYKRYNQYSLN